MATVYTTMKQSVDLAKNIGQGYSVQTYDQQLYAVAQQVKWSNPELFRTHIIRLGGFHALSCFIAAIGKIWASGGLHDLLADSGVYAPNTVDRMLQGKEFNRAVRGLTIVYESLMVLLFDAFFVWCDKEGQLANIDSNTKDVIIDCHDSFTAANGDFKHLDVVLSIVRDMIMPLFTQFRKHGSSISPTFAFWNKLLDAIEIMLLNIRAEREGLWSLHLQSVAAMLPYFFVTNRTNYSRWMSAYILDMLNLPEAMKSSFTNGAFSVRQKPGIFNGIWSDMATEKTIIKDSKGSGGIVGLTRKKPALLRWVLTRHVLAHFSSEMKSRSGLDYASESEHEENRPTAMARDEQHIVDVVKHVRENMTDPFDTTEHPKCLINISTGLQASNEVQESLANFLDRGNRMVKSFVEGCFNENQTRDFYSPISRSSIKTFDDMKKTSNLKCRSGELLKKHIDSEVIFRRALALSNVREDVTVEKVLSHPVGPVPAAMFYDDGTMRKGCKADLMHALESEVCPLFKLPIYDTSHTVLIRDGMELIQSMNVKGYAAFRDLARAYFGFQTMCFTVAEIVMDVFDRYDMTKSIKSAERRRRTSSLGAQRVYQVKESRGIPDWTKFLNNCQNKQSLLKFIGQYSEEHFMSSPVTGKKEVYMAGVYENPEIVKKFTHKHTSVPVELCSTHEEADTRIVLHCLFANSTFKNRNQMGRIIVQSPDTDVLVLLVHYFLQMENTAELWFETGKVSSTKDGRRFIPVHGICESLKPTFCNVLPAAHALTGCDTSSSCYGIGKKSLFKLLVSEADQFQSLSCLAYGDVESATKAARKLIARLYDPKRKFKDSHGDLNTLRMKLATSKDASLVRMPPCEPAFAQHILRVMLQSYVWMNAHERMPPPKEPLQFGWKEGNGGLVPVLFDGPMASDFLQDLVCSCRGKKACSKSCVCKDQNLPCTTICVCEGSDDCRNSLNQQSTCDDSDGEDDDL